jgi:hypothetical protein
MKAIITILAAILILQAGMILAGNDNISTPAMNESVVITLAPSVPMEATFEEIVATIIEVDAISPDIPIVADFYDIAPEAGFTLMNLAPLTPAVADFDDSIDLTIETSAIAPVIPAFADFD